MYVHECLICNDTVCFKQSSRILPEGYNFVCNSKKCNSISDFIYKNKFLSSKDLLDFISLEENSELIYQTHYVKVIYTYVSNFDEIERCVENSISSYYGELSRLENIDPKIIIIYYPLINFIKSEDLQSSEIKDTEYECYYKNTFSYSEPCGKIVSMTIQPIESLLTPSF